MGDRYGGAHSDIRVSLLLHVDGGFVNETVLFAGEILTTADGASTPHPQTNELSLRASLAKLTPSDHSGRRGIDSLQDVCPAFSFVSGTPPRSNAKVSD